MIVYNQVVYLPMELYYLCIDFVLQFVVEKYRNKLNQIKHPPPPPPMQDVVYNHGATIINTLQHYPHCIILPQNILICERDTFS